jgi:hypothetical protein
VVIKSSKLLGYVYKGLPYPIQFSKENVSPKGDIKTCIGRRTTLNKTKGEKIWQ